MIEFRYVNTAPDFCLAELQYRTWKIRIDASGAMTPLPLPIEWTEWQDIPYLNNEQAV
jgi:hypothetical protein